MPSEKSTRPTRDQNASDLNVEIITPLEVRRPSGKTDASHPFRSSRTIGLFLFLVLAAVAGGGLVFIRHLSRHPVNMAEETVRITRFEAYGREKEGLDDAEKTSQKTDIAAEQASAPLERQAIEPEQAIESAKIDDVNRLMESGKQHEADKRFAFALADYRAAVKSDPESMEAQKALNRVKERIAGEQFQKLMADGLTAYHDGNYQSARSALLTAKSFRPDSREAREALAQVDQAIQLEKIEILKQKAMRAEQAEDWEQALESYLAVLEIDPDIRFAVNGRERSLERIRVARRVAFFLTTPDALESDPQLQNALLLIDEAEKLQPKGPRLKARTDELKTLVTAARTPAKVTIESDNLTDVVVYKVGRLGRFSSYELSLRPGTYTLAGSRNGYRDVRETIVVKPGQESMRVTVMCTDKVEP
ncbi:MAG: tetratricopeptide repeat protein [Pseudomonadota bacterium]